MDEQLNISFDRFIRTTEPAHHRASQAIWQAMAERGDLYLGRYEGWYSVRDEAYYDEERAGRSPTAARSCRRRARSVEWTVEESWFFRLSAYQEPLLDHYRSQSRLHPPGSPPQRGAALRRGRAFATSPSRGPASTGGSRCRATSGTSCTSGSTRSPIIITGVGYPDVESETYKKFWPADLHIIGKDVVRFHAVYWPAFLMSAGIALPKQVFGHGHRPPARREDVEIGRQRRRSGRR